VKVDGRAKRLAALCLAGFALVAVGVVTARPALATATEAPSAPTLSGEPSSPTQNTGATIGFSGEAYATFECSTDSGAWVSCTDSVVLTNLADGSHSVSVRQTDLWNHTSNAATASWTVDTTAPDAPTLSGEPDARTNSTSASIGFTAEADATFTCSVDGGAYSGCTTPKALTGLIQGAHSLAVKATDQAGNTGVAATASWTVDTSAPSAPTLSGEPSSPTQNTGATIGFSGEADATFECSTDSGAWESCTDSVVLTDLADGSHSVGVRQTDLAGNTSTAATASWTVDTTTPDPVSITGVPTDLTESTSVTLGITGETGATFICTLDGGTPSACSDQKHYSGLTDGPHSVSVTQTDAAGNVSDAETKDWTIQLTPLNADETTLGFADAPVGSRAADNDQAVTLTNWTDHSVTLGSSTVAGDYKTVGTPCAGQTLLAGDSCTQTLRFIPQSVGQRSGSITFQISGSDRTVVTTLTGLGVSSPITLSSGGSLSWAGTPVGYWGPVKTMTLTNTAVAPVTIASIVRTSGSFRIYDTSTYANECLGAELAQNQSCVMHFRPLANALGDTPGSIAIGWGDTHGDWTTSASIVVHGVAKPILIDPAPTAGLNIGDVPSGLRSAARTVTLTRDSASPVTIASTEILGPTNFKIVEDTCKGKSLATATSTCAVKVVYDSGTSDIGSMAARLRIGRSGPDGTDLIDLPITADTIESTVTSDETAVDFGTVMTGHQSDPADIITLTNSSDASVVMRKTTLVGAGFRVVADSCHDRSIAAGDSCAITLRAAPVKTGALHATLQVATGGTSDVTAYTLPIGLDVIGAAPTLVIAAAPVLGATPVGALGAEKTMSVTNLTGETQMLAATLAFKTDFVISGNTCGTSIADGASCLIKIRFKPSRTGLRLETLNLTYGSPGRIVSRVLSGVGTATPAAAPTFTTLQAGRSALYRTVVLTNTTLATATVNPVVTGTGFAIAQTTCGSTLDSGATCSVLVRAWSATAGKRTGSLSLPLGDSTFALPLQATATAVVKTLTLSPPGAVDFPAKAAGEQSAALTVTVTNKSGVRRKFLAPVASAGFTVTGTTCGSTWVAANATCTVTVLANSGSVGIATGTVTVQTMDHVVTVVIPLSARNT